MWPLPCLTAGAGRNFVRDDSIVCFEINSAADIGAAVCAAGTGASSNDKNLSFYPRGVVRLGLCMLFFWQNAPLLCAVASCETFLWHAFCIRRSKGEALKRPQRLTHQVLSQLILPVRYIGTEKQKLCTARRWRREDAHGLDLS